MEELTSVEDLKDQLTALEASLGGAADMAAGFDAELRSMRAAFAGAGQDVKALERGLSRGLRRALDGIIFDGMKLSDAMRGIAGSAVNSVYSAAVSPVTSHLGGMLAQAIMPFAKGGAFSQGRVQAFANGGVVSAPTYFPMQGRTGLMGEAGPEAIMPLTRGADGKLGVRSEGGGPVHVTINISTPDVEGFRRSQTQIAAQMTRVLSRGQRNR